MNNKETIHVASYLYTGQAQGEFLPIEQATRLYGDDDMYVEGAIELAIDKVVILDQELRDYVDQLWAYIVRMVQEVESGKAGAKTYFPDQAILLTFERSGDKVRVSCKIGDELRVAEAAMNSLFPALKTAARVFFTKMIELAPDGRQAYEDALSRLS
jgi:hypothetical protein